MLLRYYYRYKTDRAEPDVKILSINECNTVNLDVKVSGM